MAYAFFTEEEQGVRFCRAAQAHFPGARAQAYRETVLGTWLYAIKFANGMVIEGPDMMVVARQADTYAQGVKNLTGEYP